MHRMAAIKTHEQKGRCEQRKNATCSLNKTWKQPSQEQLLSSHVRPISKTIQDKQGMLATAEEAKTKSYATFFYGLRDMEEPV